jgi:MFS family permease
MNLAAFIVGLAFGRIRKTLKSLTTVIGLVCLAGGLIALNFVLTFSAVLISLFFAGMGIGTLMPTIFLSTANLVPDELNGPALSITNSSLYLGQFISPLFFSVLASLFNYQDVKVNFFTGGMLTLLAALIFIVWLWVRKRQTPSETSSS